MCVLVIRLSVQPSRLINDVPSCFLDLKKVQYCTSFSSGDYLSGVLCDFEKKESLSLFRLQ